MRKKSQHHEDVVVLEEWESEPYFPPHRLVVLPNGDLEVQYGDYGNRCSVPKMHLIHFPPTHTRNRS